MKYENAKIILSEIDSHFDKIGCELNFNSPYELLVAVILSSQCTDKRVNMVTEKLFKVAPTPQKMIELGEDKIKEIIYPCGFYSVKAKNLVNCSKKLIENFNGIVPKTMEELTTLDGVGRKTASVILSEIYDIPALAVDTHVFRVSNRIGLSNSKNVLECEKQLKKLLPENEWKHTHYSLVLFGRYYCKAKGNKCESCKIKNYFKKYNKGK